MHFKYVLLFLPAVTLSQPNPQLICPWNPKGCIGRRGPVEAPTLEERQACIPGISPPGCLKSRNEDAVSVPVERREGSPET